MIKGLSVGETLTNSQPEHAIAVLNWLDLCSMVEKVKATRPN